jgi:hypothetical protein
MQTSDTRLATFGMCPLGNFSQTTDSTEACAMSLLRWLTMETFNGRQVPLPTVRKKWVSLWNRDWPDLVGTKLPPEYWAGVRAGRTVAAKLWALFDKYEVLKPFQPYELAVSAHVLTGDYAIISPRPADPRTTHQPYVLVSHPYRPITFSRPDLASLARWKHAMMSGEYIGLGIYHLPLLRGQFWRDREIAEPLVAPWLTAILDTMDRRRVFPTPSGYCESCVGKPCMGVFNAG